MTDALKLLPHVQLNGVKIDLIPGEPKNLTSAQADDEDQDEGRVQGFGSCRRSEGGELHLSGSYVHQALLARVVALRFV